MEKPVIFELMNTVYREKYIEKDAMFMSIPIFVALAKKQCDS